MADPVTLTTIAAVGTLAAAGVSAAGQISSGMRNREIAEEQARQEEAQGREEFAVSQREMLERRMAGKLAMSRMQAIAAASGGGAGSDAPTIVRLMQKSAERSAYGEQTSVYSGMRLRDALNASASTRRRTGANNFAGSMYSAAGTVLGGIGDFARIQS